MVNLKIKKKNLEAIKNGSKKNEWRELSAYNKKLLLSPREEDGKLVGNKAIDKIRLVNGFRKDSEYIIVEVKSINVYKFTKNVEIIEDNFKALEGQFAIQIALGNIVNN